MPVTHQKFIYRADLKANPDTKYLFGDNLSRVGMGGQAREMRGERNAIGVATKHAPTMADEAFFNDDEFDKLTKGILDDLQPAIHHLLQGGEVIIPQDGLGTGLSRLPEAAPRVNAYLVKALRMMESIK